MKKLISLLPLLLLAGCKAPQAVPDDDPTRQYEISWAAFCRAHGYQINNSSYQVNNEYLDTWCGSVEEENALRKAGLNPY